MQEKQKKKNKENNICYVSIHLQDNIMVTIYEVLHSKRRS